MSRLFNDTQPFSDITITDALPPEFGDATDRILSMMHTLFPYHRTLENQPGSMRELPAQIFDELAGNDIMRINKAPRGQAQERIISRIAKMVEENRPISMVALVGTAKFPDGDPEHNVADLADFGALQTIITINQRVQQVYAPGIVVRVYYEDAVGDWLFGEHSRVAQDFYYRSLEKLHNNIERQFGNPSFLVKETDVLRHLGLDYIEFCRRCEKIEPLILEYLMASEKVFADYIATTPYETWANAKRTLANSYDVFWQSFAEAHLKNLESYQALVKEGWQGFIPPEMRAFYWQRFSTNMNRSTTQDYEGRIRYMAHYYSSTLIKSQLRSVYAALPSDGAQNFDPEGALKVSFAGLAPGIPEAYQDVFQMRAFLNHKKRGGVDNCSAPWRGVGGLLIRGNGSVRVNMTPSRIFVHEEHTPAWIHLSRGGRLYAPLMVRRA
jgi:hypothetical protein